MSHGDPSHPERNLHPVRRYEVIVTADAPGPWDSVKGYLEYQVANPECTPEDKFLGVHAKPRIVGQDFEMTLVDAKTWKGYFYRDFMQDEDYYGLGVCHWQPSSVSAVFMAHGEGFDPSAVFEDFLRNGTQKQYFKKSEYFDRSLMGDQAFSTTPDDPEIAQHSDAYFPITVVVKEVTP